MKVRDVDPKVAEYKAMLLKEKILDFLFTETSWYDSSMIFFILKLLFNELDFTASYKVAAAKLQIDDMWKILVFPQLLGSKSFDLTIQMTLWQNRESARLLQIVNQ